DVVGGVLPCDFNGHVADDVIGGWLDVDEIRHEARAFVELDNRSDIGRREAGHLRAELDREGVERAAAAAPTPLDVPAEAAGAELARIEEELLARRAVGQ